MLRMTKKCTSQTKRHKWNRLTFTCIACGYVAPRDLQHCLKGAWKEADRNKALRRAA